MPAHKPAVLGRAAFFDVLRTFLALTIGIRSVWVLPGSVLLGVLPLTLFAILIFLLGRGLLEVLVALLLLFGILLLIVLIEFVSHDLLLYEERSKHRAYVV
jgi:hypothetical protein